jgi:hypothetical protein
MEVPATPFLQEIMARYPLSDVFRWAYKPQVNFYFEVKNESSEAENFVFTFLTQEVSVCVCAVPIHRPRWLRAHLRPPAPALPLLCPRTSTSLCSPPPPVHAFIGFGATTPLSLMPPPPTHTHLPPTPPARACTSRTC